MADSITMPAIACIGKVVDVEFTTDKHCKAEPLRGWLWNVDPETGCCVVVRVDGEGKAGVTTAFAHGIAAVKEAPEGEVAEEQLRRYVAAAAALTARVESGVGEGAARGGAAKSIESVTAALDKARLPYKVTDGGVVSILDGAADVRPPYTSGSIACTNDQILRKLMDLLA